jgi:cell division protein FtsQ
MDRSFAARLGIGAVSPRPTRGRAGARRTASRKRAVSTTPVDRTIALLWAAPVALLRLLARVWRLTRAHRRVRIALIAAALAVPLLAGGWLWLRGSSLLAVRDVRIVGAHGDDAAAIDAALTNAARKMSTLDVSTSELRAAVAGYPIVGAIETHASFPHSLSIRVLEQPPVATVSFDGAKTALAADGVVLGPAHASGALPTLTQTTPLTTGERVRNPMLLSALSVLSATPAPLADDIVRVFHGPKGLTLVLRGGVLAYFGDASRPHAKWLALARVLADPGSQGASYVDVRVPERPAAGFTSGVAPPDDAGEEQTEAEPTTSPATSESSQALAEGLSSAVGANASTSGSPAPSASGEHEAGSSEEAASTAASSTPSGEEAGAGGASQ